MHYFFGTSVNTFKTFAQILNGKADVDNTHFENFYWKTAMDDFVELVMADLLAGVVDASYPGLAAIFNRRLISAVMMNHDVT